VTDSATLQTTLQQALPGRRTGMYEQFNCIDYGDERPGGDLSAGIAGEVVSKKDREQGTGDRNQRPSVELMQQYGCA